VESAPLLDGDARDASIPLAEHLCGLGDIAQARAHRVEVDVHGRRREPIAVQDFSHLPRGEAEVAASLEAKRWRNRVPSLLRTWHAERVGPEELDLLESDAGQHFHRAGEVAFEELGNGEE